MSRRLIRNISFVAGFAIGLIAFGVLPMSFAWGGVLLLLLFDWIANRPASASPEGGEEL